MTCPAQVGEEPIHAAIGGIRIERHGGGLVVGQAHRGQIGVPPRAAASPGRSSPTPREKRTGLGPRPSESGINDNKPFTALCQEF